MQLKRIVFFVTILILYAKNTFGFTTDQSILTLVTNGLNQQKKIYKIKSNYILALNDYYINIIKQRLKDIYNISESTFASNKSGSTYPYSKRSINSKEVVIIDGYSSLYQLNKKTVKKEIYDEREILAFSSKTPLLNLIKKDDLIRKIEKYQYPKQTNDKQIHEMYAFYQEFILKEMANRVCLKTICGNNYCTSVSKQKFGQVENTNDIYLKELQCSNKSPANSFNENEVAAIQIIDYVISQSIGKTQKQNIDLFYIISTQKKSFSNKQDQKKDDLSDDKVINSPTAKQNNSSYLTYMSSIPKLAYNGISGVTQYIAPQKALRFMGNFIGGAKKELVNTLRSTDISKLYKNGLTGMTTDIIKAGLTEAIFYSGTDKEGDLSKIPELVKEHIKKHSAFLTEEQKSIITGWNRKAIVGLKQFKNDYLKSGKLFLTDDKDKNSLAAIEEGKRRDQLAKGPTIEVLEEENPELLNILLALRKFLHLPAKIKTVNPDYVRQKSKETYFTSRFLHEKLGTLATSVAQSTQGDRPLPGDKLFYVAVSGPGTGKTTAISNTIKEWLGLPLCILTGEQINNWSVPKNKIIWDLIEDWIIQCTTEKFAIDNENYLNGFILFDDVHYALQTNGALGKDNKSRQSFFRFLKNIGDKNQQSIFKINLGKDLYYPSNFSWTRFIMTLNELPDEFQVKSKFYDQPTHNRLSDLNAAYPDKKDRIRMAQDQYYLKIEPELNAFENLYEQDKTTFKTHCLKSLEIMAKRDYEIVVKKFKGKLGVRGFSALLTSYIERTKSRMKLTKGNLNINAGKLVLSTDHKNMSLSEDDEWLERTIGTIEDYKSKVNEKLELTENLKEFNEKIEKYIDQLSKDKDRMVFTHFEWEIINDHITKLENKDTPISVRKKYLSKLENFVNRARIKLKLPRGEEIGQKLEIYFKSKEGYNEIIQAGREIFLRQKYFRGRPSLKVKSSTEKFEQEKIDNKIIRLVFDTYNDFDKRIVPTFAKAFGHQEQSIPICQIAWTNDLYKPRKNIYRIDKDGKEEYIFNKYNRTFKFNNGLKSNVFQTSHNYSGYRYHFFTPFGATKDIFLLSPENSNEFKLWNDSKVTLNTEWFYKISNSQNLNLRREDDSIEHIDNYFRGFDNVMISHCMNTNKGMSSSPYSFISIYLNRQLLEFIERKQKYLFGDNKIVTDTYLDKFEKSLYKLVNSGDLIQNEDHGIIDPRGFTIFLIMDKEKRFFFTNSEQSMDITFSPPTLENRAQLAIDLLNGYYLSQIKNLIERRLGEKVDVSLTKQESRVLDELIEYDKQMFLHVKKIDGKLPISILEDAIKDLSVFIGNRLDNPLKVKIMFPKINHFKVRWEKSFYGPFIQKVQQEYQHKLKIARMEELNKKEKEKKKMKSKQEFNDEQKKQIEVSEDNTLLTNKKDGDRPQTSQTKKKEIESNTPNEDAVNEIAKNTTS